MSFQRTCNRNKTKYSKDVYGGRRDVVHYIHIKRNHCTRCLYCEEIFCLYICTYLGYMFWQITMRKQSQKSSLSDKRTIKILQLFIEQKLCDNKNRH